jgi:EAL domain-containing protein (putative c-di-GMP-specific phosphodiesterase class I)/GGDEF domain-containing protein
VESIVKPYLIRASLLAGATVLLGILLSYVIYQASNEIRENGIDLVDNRVPILTGINEFIADLNTQERIIYEYYATQDSQQFLLAFSNVKDTIKVHEQALFIPQKFSPQLTLLWSQQINIISSKQMDILALADEFHQIMLVRANNWNYLRTLLADISNARREMFPALNKISEMTKNAVKQGHKNTLAQINFTHNMVIVYGFSLIIIGGLVAWYIKKYILKNAENVYLAYYMQKTNLPNQYKLNEDLNELIITNKHFSIAIFALRDFSQMVTSLGGSCTDDIVKSLTEIVAKELPLGVNLYQLNESQFALVCVERLSTLSLQEATAKVLSAAGNAISTPCGDFFIEIDLGCCLFPEHGQDIDTLIKNAQTALVVASHHEHHHFAMFEMAFATQLSEKKRMADNLRVALKNGDFFLVFQPQLDLIRQKITGIETLVRWRHQGDIISPAEFIPLAERSGLIVPLGEWILTQACYFAKHLVEQGFTELVVAVNVSPRQFSHPNFKESVKDVLAETNLPAKNLELEITEGVFMHHEQSTLSLLHQLKVIGVQLSIDDFGTGYSSLSYLKQFPVDKLKIDQSFIKDLHTNDEDKAIVKTIVTLGKSLGLSLIAEGVEELTHVEFLKEIKCDEIQGYWYSRPLEADKLLAFLQEQSTS